MNTALEGAGRGSLGAMAMTGMRAFTVGAGLVEEAPPRAIFRQKSKGFFHLVPKRKRRAAIEVTHWAVGAAGGALFAGVPEDVRRRRWAGPLFGLVVWFGFEAVLAPALGLSQAKKVRPLERLALAADHALYGFVLGGRRKT